MCEGRASVYVIIVCTKHDTYPGVVDNIPFHDLPATMGVETFFFFFFFFLNLTYSRWTSSLPSCLWGHEGSSHLSPVHAFRFFYRDASSAIVQLVNQWLDFYLLTFPRFPLRKKEHKHYLVRIELTTSALAGVQVTYWTTRGTPDRYQVMILEKRDGTFPQSECFVRLHHISTDSMIYLERNSTVEHHVVRYSRAYTE